MAGLFLSTFVNKIDKKGRVSVPAPFRAALMADPFQGVVVFPSLKLKAIEGFAMERMEKLNQHLEGMDIFSQEQEDWSASIFAQAQPLSFDPEGRVFLPEPLRDYGQIQDKVAFAGRGSTFQMWNPEALEAYQKEARRRLELKAPLTASKGGN